MIAMTLFIQETLNPSDRPRLTVWDSCDDPLHGDSQTGERSFLALFEMIVHKTGKQKMTTYISILRGINVSGQKMIKMDALKQMYAELNFKNIHTYIQSGNVVFQNKKAKEPDLEKKISKKILEQFGFEVPVLVRDIEYLKQVLKNNPFAKDKTKDISYLHVTFLSAIPEQTKFDKVKDGQYQEDEFHLSGNVIYLFCPNGYGNSKLSNNFFESKLKVVATTRNWKTTNELVSIAEKIEE